MQRLNLHDALARQAFDHAVICTFTFEPQFFEGYCLDHFRSLAENNNITVILDRGIYDGLIHVPASEWPRLANIRYLLHPIGVPGRFHPKLFLFANRDKGLLAIGSGNFTKPGLTSNAELVGLYRYEHGKHEQHVALFRQAIQFLTALAQRWKSSEYTSNLQAILDDAQWLAPQPETYSPLRLIHNLDRPLWDQIREGIKEPVDEIHVLSRYFDAEPLVLTRILDEIEVKRIVLWTENGITTMTPSWFQHPAVRNRVVSVRNLMVKDDEHRQPLHAKAVAILSGRTLSLAFGSANFTTAGLFLPSSHANVEILVTTDELPFASCQPKILFDPCGTAQTLRNASELRTAPRDLQQPRQPSPPINLHEAILSDHRLTCRCTVSVDLPDGIQLKAILTFSDGGELSTGLVKSADALVAAIDDSTEKECSEGTTVVHLEADLKDSPPLVSNHTLLINLRDIESGRSQRRERRIHEAKKSAEQFAAMLGELLRLGETDALQTFLTHCDIPIINAARPYSLHPRPQWAGGDLLLLPGQRSLRAYSSLHDAAMGFCERHIRRLRRHCGRASAAGIPNFMHIALAVANVLRAQIERAIVGLETLKEPLTIDEWYNHRTRLEEYLRTFRTVIDILDQHYIPALQKRFKASAIREAIIPDLDPLTSICRDFLLVRERIEACISGSLRVQGPDGRVGIARIFNHDLLAPMQWLSWSSDVQKCIDRNMAWSEAA